MVCAVSFCWPRPDSTRDCVSNSTDAAPSKRQNVVHVTIWCRTSLLFSLHVFTMSFQLCWLTAVHWHREVVWKLPKSCPVKNERLVYVPPQSMHGTRNWKTSTTAKLFFAPGRSGVKEALWNAANPFGASISFERRWQASQRKHGLSHNVMLWFHLKMHIFISYTPNAWKDATMILQ